MPSSAPRTALSATLRSFRGLFLAVGAFSLAINLLMLTPAVYMLQIYDRVLASRNTTTLLMLTLIMVGLYALEAALEWVRSRALIRASAAMDLRVGPVVFDAAYERTLRGKSGSAQQALGDLTNIRQFVTGKGLFAFFDAPWTPIYLLVIFLLHPWLGWFATGAAVLLLLLAWVNEIATARALAGANREAQGATHYASTHLRNAEVIAAMGMLERLRTRWVQRQSRMLSLQSHASDRAAAVGAATKFVRVVCQSGVLGVGALLVIDGQLSPGGMIAASILLGRALAPVDQAMGSWRSLVQARGAYARLQELMTAHPPQGPRVALPRPTGLVMAEGLVVGPPGSRQPVVRGVSFGASPGMLVAVIGASASGKSSLARALVGVWSPMSGTVRLDGADVAQWDKAELGQWVGYLPQDVELFEGTVAENIARLGPLDSDQIVRAARRAGVHEMVLRLPQGYETPIGEGGAALSGGQRQRIGLARALYGDPALIVLDEPNANLDEAGDAALVAALRELQRAKCTVFVMTHRLNILSIVDAVLVMDNGKISAYGPRDAVLESLRAQPKGAGATGATGGAADQQAPPSLPDSAPSRPAPLTQQECTA
ncbi:MAG: type I secretion system permease/ATPase [Hydrogenophaga sp.]|jgi:ATP-binding cassette subfamily C exporter for protease/lipase|nr:type I secretion system permease/ATPase [Hydrogenophaga sp.]